MESRQTGDVDQRFLFGEKSSRDEEKETSEKLVPHTNRKSNGLIFLAVI